MHPMVVNKKQGEKTEAAMLTGQLSRPPGVLMNSFWIWKLASSMQAYMEAPVCKQ